MVSNQPVIHSIFKNFEKTAAKQAIEKTILFNFVNLSTIFYED